MKKYILVFIALLLSCNSQDKKPQTANVSGTVSYNRFISNIKLPDTLTFCGEIVPLDDPEVKERAERELYLLIDDPGQIMLYFKRSGRYFPLYERIFKETNMPDDLKYLSVAESALYQSTSRAGAVGLWQFMRGTARDYGMHVSDFVDERRNPEKSTYAAMKYLKDAYARTNSWTLSAAGYNMGVGGINKAMKFHVNAEDYFDLYLNSETSRYVFRIVIIKEIMSNPEKYGFDISENELYKPYKTKTVNWTGAINNLSEWAADHGTSYKEVKILNPWILKKSLRPPLSGQKYEILIPEDAAVDLNE